MTDATLLQPLGPVLRWNLRSMSRDDTDPRPSTSAAVSVANPRRTRLPREVVAVTTRPDEDVRARR